MEKIRQQKQWTTWLPDQSRNWTCAHEIWYQPWMDDTSQTRQNFIRQTAFVPCDCDKCFFCLNGHTNGITHRSWKQSKVTVECACGTQVMTSKCTSDLVDLGMRAGDYCWMCYHKLLSTEFTVKARKKLCRTSRLGCPIFKEPICKECLREGYDKHAFINFT